MESLHTELEFKLATTCTYARAYLLDCVFAGTILKTLLYSNDIDEALLLCGVCTNP